MHGAARYGLRLGRAALAAALALAAPAPCARLAAAVPSTVRIAAPVPPTLYRRVDDPGERARVAAAILRAAHVTTERWLLSLEQTRRYLDLTLRAEPGFRPQAAMPVDPGRLDEVRALFGRLLAEERRTGRPALAGLADAVRRGHVALYRIDGKSEREGRLRVTRYFAAREPARERRGGTFTRALYRLPPDSLRDASGRLPSKQRIHAGALEGKAAALAWLTPKGEAELQMEGSGLLELPGGRVVAVNYEGNNGYVWSDEDREARRRLVARHGKVPWSAWPQFKKRHSFHRAVDPTELRHLLLVPGQFLGFDRPWHRKMPITEGISAAMDPALVPSGAIGVLVAPGAARLVKIDDQGAAFIGRPDKIDLFWGSFRRSELAAGRTDGGRAIPSFPDWAALYFLAGTGSVPESASPEVAPSPARR
jgi:hypothetical protein